MTEVVERILKIKFDQYVFSTDATNEPGHFPSHLRGPHDISVKIDQHVRAKIRLIPKCDLVHHLIRKNKSVVGFLTADKRKNSLDHLN